MDCVVSSTSKVPAITASPPILKFLARPRPPSITAAPLLISVESVVFWTSNVPAISAFPPILIFFTIPTPPSTFSAPLVVLDDSVVPKIWVLSPTNNFFSIPTPPSTCKAPLLVLEESVVSLNVTTPSTSRVLLKVTSPSVLRLLSKSTSDVTWRSPLTSNCVCGFCWFIPTLDCLYIAAPAPVPWWPHKSWVNIVANPVLTVGSWEVGIKVSVPCPKLFCCTKLRIVNDCAAPTVGTYVPSSWRKIPSVIDGSKFTQRIPFASRFIKKPFWPGDPAES